MLRRTLEETVCFTQPLVSSSECQAYDDLSIRASFDETLAARLSLLSLGHKFTLGNVTEVVIGFGIAAEASLLSTRIIGLVLNEHG